MARSAPVDASTTPAESGRASDPPLIETVWIDPPERRPSTASVEHRRASEVAIEVLRIARQDVLSSANPCAIESPSIVARRAHRLLDDRLEEGPERDVIAAEIDRLADRA